VYRTLMQCTAATLTEFAANPRWLGAMSAFTLVLHTWTQDLRRHIHVHALMACGGLDADARWRTPKRSLTFLFPVHALSAVFRGKFLDALRRASQAGGLPVDPADTDAARQTRLLHETKTLSPVAGHPTRSMPTQASISPGARTRDHATDRQASPRSPSGPEAVLSHG
jgi:hypothetical protein